MRNFRRCTQIRVALATTSLLGSLLGIVVEIPIAHAVDCDTLPTPIYGLGGSAAKPLIARFATELSDASPPMTVIFQAPGACQAISAFIDETELTGTASYWTSAGVETQCDLPLAGVAVDYGYMGNTATFCPGVDTAPSGVIDVPGPVTAWNLLVPVASSQKSISSEALFIVYGFGNQSQASPWTDEAQLFRRATDSGALLAIAAASTLPPERFLGTDALSQNGMITLLSGSVNPEAAIGFVSGEVADANRDKVRTLAYQHKGQSVGYWPDSSATTFDKINVRDGRYWLWAFHHFFAHVNGSNQFVDENVERFIRLITDTATDDEGIPILDIFIENGNVPRCAMNVTRTSDYTPLIPYDSPEPCGCYFEFKATGETSCEECSNDDDCTVTAPKCRNGYCEEK